MRGRFARPDIVDIGRDKLVVVQARQVVVACHDVPRSPVASSRPRSAALVVAARRQLAPLTYCSCFVLIVKRPRKSPPDGRHVATRSLFVGLGAYERQRRSARVRRAGTLPASWPAVRVRRSSSSGCELQPRGHRRSGRIRARARWRGFARFRRPGFQAKCPADQVVCGERKRIRSQFIHQQLGGRDVGPTGGVGRADAYRVRGAAGRAAAGCRAAESGRSDVRGAR